MNDAKGVRLTDEQETVIGRLLKNSSLKRGDLVRAGFSQFIKLPDSEIITIAAQFRIDQLTKKRASKKNRGSFKRS